MVLALIVATTSTIVGMKGNNITQLNRGRYVSLKHRKLMVDDSDCRNTEFYNSCDKNEDWVKDINGDLAPIVVVRDTSEIYMHEIWFKQLKVGILQVAKAIRSAGSNDKHQTTMGIIENKPNGCCKFKKKHQEEINDVVSFYCEIAPEIIFESDEYNLLKKKLDKTKTYAFWSNVTLGIVGPLARVCLAWLYLKTRNDA